MIATNPLPRRNNADTANTIPRKGGGSLGTSNLNENAMVQ